MEISSLASIILAACSIIGLLVQGFTVAMFVVIKFNDLKHLENNTEEIKKMLAAETDERKKAVKELWAKTDNSAERISTIEGKCAANHKDSL